MKTSKVTYAPLTMAGFEEAIANAEGERLSSAIDYTPISDEAFDGEKVDHPHLDEFCVLGNYVAGCDPYKEEGEGSIGLNEDPSVLIFKEHVAEVGKKTMFKLMGIPDEK